MIPARRDESWGFSRNHMSQTFPLPNVDPTPLFELFRGSYATELLTAAVAHFHLFGKLAPAPRTPRELGADLGLAERPLHVLVTALCALGRLEVNAAGQLLLADVARAHRR